MPKPTAPKLKAPSDKWDPQWIGVIRSYPRTEAAFIARQESGRAILERLRAEGRPATTRGARRRYVAPEPEAERLKTKARKMARAALKRMIDDGSVDEGAANESLLVALAIVNDPTELTSDRLKAIKIVTDCLKPKPTVKVDTTISPAEAWLASIAGK